AIKLAEPADEKFFLDAISVSSKRSDVLHKAIKESIEGDRQAMALFEAVNQQREAYRSARKAVLAKKTAGDLDGVRKFHDTEMVPRVQSYNEAVGAMVTYQQGAVDKDAALLQDEFS